MPFRNHHFDAALMDEMRSAFSKVCTQLALASGREDQLTDVIVEKVVALARVGVHNSDDMAKLILMDLRGSEPAP